MRPPLMHWAGILAGNSLADCMTCLHSKNDGEGRSSNTGETRLEKLTDMC